MKKIYKKENKDLFGLKPYQVNWQYNTISGNYIISHQERLDSNQRHRQC